MNRAEFNSGLDQLRAEFKFECENCDQRHTGQCTGMCWERIESSYFKNNEIDEFAMEQKFCPMLGCDKCGGDMIKVSCSAEWSYICLDCRDINDNDDPEASKSWLKNNPKFVAVTSTTVLPLDGTYSVKTLSSVPDIKDVPNYIGHPVTQNLVLSLGAIPAKDKLFGGLEISQTMVCASIKQGQNNRANGGSEINQNITPDQLDWRIVRRVA
jgi:hypothetical protein